MYCWFPTVIGPFNSCTGWRVESWFFLECLLLEDFGGAIVEKNKEIFSEKLKVWKLVYLILSRSTFKDMIKSSWLNLYKFLMSFLLLLTLYFLHFHFVLELNTKFFNTIISLATLWFFVCTINETSIFTLIKFMF